MPAIACGLEPPPAWRDRVGERGRPKPLEEVAGAPNLVAEFLPVSPNPRRDASVVTSRRGPARQDQRVPRGGVLLRECLNDLNGGVVARPEPPLLGLVRLVIASPCLVEE